ncbi:MAG: hypothetical protein RSF86_02515 [Angelakisella sp.]
MKLRLLAAALLCCTAFSGCVPMQTNVENLMQPPKLTALQYQVDTALREAVGRNFTLKYPRNGKYKSAFNFIDLSGDGIDEAIAFFATTEDYIQVAVLTQTEGSWMVSDILPGLSFCTEVDFVSFEKVGSAPRLMVGWGGTGIENNIMAIYGYTAADGEQPVLKLDSRWDYNRMTVTDIDQNGISELLLLVAANSYDLTSPMAQLVGETSEGVIDLLAETELPRNIATFLSPVMGGIGNNLYGATLDCVLNNGNLCTVTLALQDGQLVMPLNDMDQNLFRKTIRTQYVVSSDINNDGIVDIPVERPAKGYVKDSSEAIYFSEYSNIQADKLATIQTAYVNHAKGYRFLFPDSWTDQPVSAQVQPDGTEVIFFLNPKDDLYDHSMELVRIKVYSTQDGQDLLDGNRYFQLAAKGTYLYCAALPSVPVEELALTKGQVGKLFSLVTG